MTDKKPERRKTAKIIPFPIKKERVVRKMSEHGEKIAKAAGKILTAKTTVIGFDDILSLPDIKLTEVRRMQYRSEVIAAGLELAVIFAENTHLWTADWPKKNPWASILQQSATLCRLIKSASASDQDNIYRDCVKLAHDIDKVSKMVIHNQKIIDALLDDE